MRAFRENTVSLICFALKRELVVALNTQLAAAGFLLFSTAALQVHLIARLGTQLEVNFGPKRVNI